MVFVITVLRLIFEHNFGNCIRNKAKASNYLVGFNVSWENDEFFRKIIVVRACAIHQLFGVTP